LTTLDSRGPTISLVTATFNASNSLPTLIDSLCNQTDRDFEWVVADGASDDGTIELLKSVTDIHVVISSQPDFGIYDALNRAVKNAKGDYYLVLGADDVLYPDSIASFRRIASNGQPDMVSARVKVNGKVYGPRRGQPWLYGAFAYVTGHSVSTLIKKSLHEKFGYYSKFYPLVADQFFFKRAGDAGARIELTDFVAGEYGTQGSSSRDVLGMLTEGFRVQLATGESKVVQSFLFLMRLIKLFKKF